MFLNSAKNWIKLLKWIADGLEITRKVMEFDSDTLEKYDHVDRMKDDLTSQIFRLGNIEKLGANGNEKCFLLSFMELNI
jgi:hypothetical protein